MLVTVEEDDTPRLRTVARAWGVLDVDRLPARLLKPEIIAAYQRVVTAERAAERERAA